MIVVDAGAWALALTSSDRVGERAREALSIDPHWTMPAHGPIETLRTIRRLESASHITSEGAFKALEAMCQTKLDIVLPEPWMLEAIWEVRRNVSPYNAAYLVIAQQAHCSLVTLDKRLARACLQLGVEPVIPGETFY